MYWNKQFNQQRSVEPPNSQARDGPLGLCREAGPISEFLSYLTHIVFKAVNDNFCVGDLGAN